MELSTDYQKFGLKIKHRLSTDYQKSENIQLVTFLLRCLYTILSVHHYFDKHVCLSICPCFRLSVFPCFRHKIFFSPNQQMLLIDVVTYASVMTKMCSASSRDPLGALGGPKRARGVTPKVGQMKKCY